MPSPLVLDGIISLPVVAETAAWLVPSGNDLRILINQSAVGTTAHLRVSRLRELTTLSAVPVVAAGAVSCGGELLVTGADASGRPRVVSLAGDGTIRWDVAITGDIPTRWPTPACAPEPAIVWQTDIHSMRVAMVGPHGVTAEHAFAVCGPPLDVAVAGSSIWVVCVEAGGVTVIESTRLDRRQLLVDPSRPAAIAVAATPRGAWVTWAVDRVASLIFVPTGADDVVTRTSIDVGAPAPGTVAVVAGPKPLIWAQRFEAIEGTAPRWTSVIAVPAGDPLVIGTHLYAVEWWGNLVAALAATEVRLYRRMARD